MEPQRVPEQRLITPALETALMCCETLPAALQRQNAAKLESGQDTAHALLRTQLS